MIKLLIGILLISTVNAGEECNLRESRKCLQTLYATKITPTSACNAIEDVKLCYVEHGCCHEYRSQQCLKVLEKTQLWKNIFADFNGCETKICSCRPVDAFKKKHIDQNMNSSIGFWFFFIWCGFIIIILYTKSNNYAH